MFVFPVAFTWLGPSSSVVPSGAARALFLSHGYSGQMPWAFLICLALPLTAALGDHVWEQITGRMPLLLQLFSDCD